MKLSAKISLCFLVTAVILTSISVVIVKKSLEDGIYAHLRSVSHSMAHHIETFIDEDKRRIELMAGSGLLQSAVEKIVHNTNDSYKYAAEANLLLSGFRELGKEAYEILVISPDGKVIASDNELNVGKDKSAESFFLRAMDNTFVTDFYSIEEQAERGYFISTPIRNGKTKEMIGLLVAAFRMTGLNEITVNRIGLGKTGEVFIVNKNGYMITPSRFDKDTLLKENSDTFSTRFINPDNFAETEKVNTFSGYKNEMVHGIHEYITELQWYVLTQIDVEEALAPITKIKRVLLGILIIIPLTAWALGVFCSGIVTKPLKKLQKGTEKVGMGDLDHKIGISSEDEIGRLSRAFDRMTYDLKQTTTSVDALNKEIAERKMAEDMLRESEEKYKRIVETARAVILLISTDYHILEFNKEAERIYGCNREDVLGKNYMDLFLPEEFMKGVVVNVNKVMAGEATIVFENPVIGCNGSETTLRWNFTRIMNSEEEPVGFLAIGHDITDRKESEENLRKAKEEAESANLAKTRFLANISHELRTPMNSVLGFADLMKDTPMNDTQKDYVQTIYSSGRILLNLINDILDLSKIEAGEIDIENIPFNIKLLSESLIKIIRPRMENKDIKVVFKIEDGMPVLFVGDPTRIRQILLNLLSNAVRFTDEGEIILSLDEDKSGKETMEEHISKIRITVKDTGIGISRDKQNVIFDAFVQEDSSTTRRYGGTGLGLTIVKRLVEAMHGEIKVLSEKGKGSEFTVTLLLNKQRRIRDNDLSQLKKPDISVIKGVKVLLVEDDEMNMKLINRMLDKLGCITDTVFDGKEAIEKTRDNKYDLVLMDIQLPLMNGIQATEIIRREIDGDVPIIALTAAAMKGDKERAIASGMNDYLIKPVDSVEIEAILLKLFLHEEI